MFFVIIKDCRIVDVLWITIAKFYGQYDLQKVTLRTVTQGHFVQSDTKFTFDLIIGKIVSSVFVKILKDQVVVKVL